jgi:hypothetical protein
MESGDQSANSTAVDSSQPEGQTMLPSLANYIERIRSIAYGGDDSLKQSVLASFTAERLAEAENQLEAVPKAEVATAQTARVQERTTERVATMPIAVSNPQDAAEREATQIASAVVCGRSVNVGQANTQEILNRQVGEALVAAGSGLLVTEAELAPGEVVTGPPGWVVGGVVLLAAVGLLAAGYLLTRSKVCPPCPAAPPIEIDRVPPSSPHFPCPGDHWHFRVYNQNPQTCDCFLSGRLFGGCCGIPGAPC